MRSGAQVVTTKFNNMVSFSYSSKRIFAAFEEKPLTQEFSLKQALRSGIVFVRISVAVNKCHDQKQKGS